MKKQLISIDLNQVAESAAKVSVFDRGFLFGDSIYETVRTYQGRLFTFDEHFDRLERSAAAIYLKLPFERKTLRQHLESLVTQIGSADCAIRIIVSRGVSEVSVEPPAIERPTTVIIAKTMTPWPAKDYQNGIRLVTPQVRRNPKAALDPMIKSGNYLNSVLAIYQARQAGADDAAILGTDEQLTETPNANLFFVIDGVVTTPSLTDGVLDGITRELILAICAENKIPSAQKRLRQSDVAKAQECFIASTTRELMPVRQLDAVNFTIPGALTQRLSKLYRERVARGLV